MKIVPFDEDRINAEYRDFYNQKGGTYIPVFKGASYQKGHGIGGILSSLFKSAAPLIKRGASSLGKTVLKSGLGILKDGMNGMNIKDSAIKHLKSAGRDIISKSVNHVTNTSRKRKLNRHRSVPHKRVKTNQTRARRKHSAKQIRHRDIFS